MTLIKPSKTHTFTNGTAAQAPQVNTNFSDIFGVLEEDAYLAKGWFLVDNASFEYHASDAIKTTADVDLTSILQEGDKITWEHATTGGDRFGWISVIDYNTTVANRTYIKIIGSAVLNEGVETDSVGISRIAHPWGWSGSFLLASTSNRNLYAKLDEDNFEIYGHVASLGSGAAFMDISFSYGVTFSRVQSIQATYIGNNNSFSSNIVSFADSIPSGTANFFSTVFNNSATGATLRLKRTDGTYSNAVFYACSVNIKGYL